MASASITRNSAFDTPCCSAKAAARLAWLPDKVMPTTLAEAPNFFARNLNEG